MIKQVKVSSEEKMSKYPFFIVLLLSLASNMFSCKESGNPELNSKIMENSMIIHCMSSAEMVLLHVEMDGNGNLVENEVGRFELQKGENVIPLHSTKYNENYIIRFAENGDIENSDFRGDYLPVLVSQGSSINVRIEDMSNVLMSSSSNDKRTNAVIRFEQLNYPLIDLFKEFSSEIISVEAFRELLAYELLSVNQRKFNYLLKVEDCAVNYTCYSRMFSELTELRKHNRSWIKECYNQDKYLFRPSVYHSLDKLITSKAFEKSRIDTIGYSIDNQFVVSDFENDSPSYIIFASMDQIDSSLFEVSEETINISIVVVDYFDLEESESMNFLNSKMFLNSSTEIQFIKPSLHLIEKVRLQGTPEMFRILADGSFYSEAPPN